MPEGCVVLYPFNALHRAKLLILSGVGVVCSSFAVPLGTALPAMHTHTVVCCSNQREAVQIERSGAQLAVHSKLLVESRLFVFSVGLFGCSIQ